MYIQSVYTLHRGSAWCESTVSIPYNTRISLSKWTIDTGYASTDSIYKTIKILTTGRANKLILFVHVVE